MPSIRPSPGDVDLVVEVTDVPHDGLMLHAGHVLGGDDVPVACRRHEDIGGVDHVVKGQHLVTLHGRLQRADGVDLGDHHPRSLALEGLGAALAHVPEPADDGHLAPDEHVRGPVDAVDE